jgi:2-furoyl-CoA dehydrogenase FAD binding subunit
MKPAPFDYVRPDTLEQTLDTLSRAGEDARILAGGQSLGAMLNMRIVRPAIIVDINRAKGLDRIEARDGRIVTPALVRQADALADAAIRDTVPLLAQALPHVGHYQTRNRGTLCGSAAHGDPSAEIPLVLATLNGEVELRSRRRSRKVKARAFWRAALTTIREADECVVALHWPQAAPGARHAFSEFSIREGDFAVVAVACVIEAGKVTLGFGGCGDIPQIVERAVSGPIAADDIASEAAKTIECRSDPFASGDYRRHLAFTLAKAALSENGERHA